MQRAFGAGNASTTSPQHGESELFPMSKPLEGGLALEQGRAEALRWSRLGFASPSNPVKSLPGQPYPAGVELTVGPRRKAHDRGQSHRS